MATFGAAHRSVLQRYPRAVVHLRGQLKPDLNRFGLVLGAGFNACATDYRIPTWEKLVGLLAVDPAIQGADLLKAIDERAGLPYRTEMLFEHFKSRCYAAEVAADRHNTVAFDSEIGSNWRKIIRKHLYANASADISSVYESHLYLRHYLPLIQRTYMTVTYNFDDTVERVLGLKRPEKERDESRGYESVTNPLMQFRRENAIVYHPNGVIPQRPMETPSDRFVFSEASFAEQLMGIFAGDQAGLISHLCKHTCLFIGLSLEDETLKAALLQAARSSPGNFHYYVFYLDNKSQLDDEQKEAMHRTNFKVYNLITLFLTTEEICALAELIDPQNMSTEDLLDLAKVVKVDVRYVFYLTGALGVGKTTTLNQFRNLNVVDEWLEQRPAVLAKESETELSDAEREAADAWVIPQFELKNKKVRHIREGIIMLDRGPLDPLSFTPASDWSAKADRILQTLSPDPDNWKVEDGRVVFLHGDPKELAVRMVLTERPGYTADTLSRMQTNLLNVYGKEGVSHCDAGRLPPADVAKRVAEIVHLEDYRPTCQLHERLQQIQQEKIQCRIESMTNP